MTKYKLIAVSQETYESLRRFGEFRDSFDDVITKILHRLDLEESNLIGDVS
jgi:predicted CopG family antitoxin